MKKKSAIKGLAAFGICFVLLDILFFPVVMNLVLMPLLAQERMVEGIGILAWKPCFSSFVSSQITIGFQIMLVAGVAALYVSNIRPSFSHGDEHGSARLLTDEEFDALVPSYTFTGKKKEE